ncbi:MAG: hypothetical protein LBT05_13960 [Planctomycetaceae bacterium]|jgi:hypothetical protein|nr:hypothetical protein [Planctomycetaceae bacterium]
MKKFWMLFVISVVAAGFSTGCNGFKGFCDKGSLFPTRQPQVMPIQSSYAITSDVCASHIVTNPCDPCCEGMDGGPFSEPITP